MTRFLTVEQAATRVDKSVRTIGRWVDGGLKIVAGLIREDELLETDLLMRERRGRPRNGVDRGVAVFNEIIAERARQNAKWGEQNHPDGTGGSAHPLEFHEARVFHNDFAPLLAEIAKQSTDARAAAGSLTWLDILLEEVFEALAESDPARLRAELIQVAAVAAQWAEAIDRRAA